MKNKTTKVSLNMPIILDFGDYHEIKYVQDYFNKVIAGKRKIKSKELATPFGYYYAIFYFKKDNKYHKLIKNHMQISK